MLPLYHTLVHPEVIYRLITNKLVNCVIPLPCTYPLSSVTIVIVILTVEVVGPPTC